MASRRIARVDPRSLARELDINADGHRVTLQRFNELIEAAGRVVGPLSERVQLMDALRNIAVGYGHFKARDDKGRFHDIGNLIASGRGSGPLERNPVVGRARDRAAAAFARLGGERLLTDRLSDTERALSNDFIIEDVQMLGMVASPTNARAIEAISRIIQDAGFSIDTRLHAVDALADIGGPRCEAALIRAIGSSERGIVSAAINALGRIGSERARTALDSMRRDHPEWAGDIQNALSQIMRRSRPRVAERP